MEENPYLSGMIPTSSLSVEGESLKKLVFPNISTLFSEIKVNKTPINLVGNSNYNVSDNKIIPIGINLNTKSNLTNLFAKKVQISDVEYNTDSNDLPKNFEQAYKQRYRISHERTGKNNNLYSQKELRQIANNLDISSTNDKKSLVTNILAAIDRWSGETTNK